MWYRCVKRVFVLSVNALNALLLGNLPPFVTACVVVEEQGRFLVVEPSDGRMTFPGGFVRWREHSARAACREGKEETGLSLCIKGVVGCYPCASSRFSGVSCLVVAFGAEVVGGALRGSGEGKPGWVEEREVRARMGALDQRILETFLTRGPSRAHLDDGLMRQGYFKAEQAMGLHPVLH